MKFPVFSHSNSEVSLHLWLAQNIQVSRVTTKKGKKVLSKELRQTAMKRASEREAERKQLAGAMNQQVLLNKEFTFLRLQCTLIMII